mmetsp:Transcript_31729/g.77689  ORF Transcript_31729/g.77689 Transcript_31729/m.77689 type:complete len:221 (+) Transcript_31729:334-996(+)
MPKSRTGLGSPVAQGNIVHCSGVHCEHQLALIINHHRRANGRVAAGRTAVTAASIVVVVVIVMAVHLDTHGSTSRGNARRCATTVAERTQHALQTYDGIVAAAVAAAAAAVAAIGQQARDAHTHTPRRDDGRVQVRHSVGGARRRLPLPRECDHVAHRQGRHRSDVDAGCRWHHDEQRAQRVAVGAQQHVVAQQLQRQYDEHHFEQCGVAQQRRRRRRRP